MSVILLCLATTSSVFASGAAASRLAAPASFQRALARLESKSLTHSPLTIGRRQAFSLGAGELGAQASEAEAALVQSLLDDAWTDLFRSRAVRQVCFFLLNADPILMHAAWGISMERAARLAPECRAEANSELAIDLFRDRNDLLYADSPAHWPRRFVFWRYANREMEDQGLSFLLRNGSIQHHFLSNAVFSDVSETTLSAEYEHLLRALAYQSVGVYFDALLTDSLSSFIVSSESSTAEADLNLIEANPLARLSFAVARARSVENQIIAEIKGQPVLARDERNCIEQFVEDARASFPILGVQLGQSADYMVGVLARFENIPLAERISMVFTIDYLARSLLRGHSAFEESSLRVHGGAYIGHVATLFQARSHARKFLVENFSVISERLYRFSNLLGLLGNQIQANPAMEVAANSLCAQLSRPRLDGTLGRGRPVVPWVR